MTADDASLLADAHDRRTALAIASENARAGSCTLHGCENHHEHVLREAATYYRWLRHRDTLRAVAAVLIPLEGSPMDTTYSGPDTDAVLFAVGGRDVKNSQTAPPADTWDYALNDPDNSGAQLAVAPDLLSATVTPGAASANVSLTMTGQNTGMVATCAITFTAGAAVGVELVPAAPVPPAA